MGYSIVESRNLPAEGSMIDRVELTVDFGNGPKVVVISAEDYKDEAKLKEHMAHYEEYFKSIK